MSFCHITATGMFSFKTDENMLLLNFTYFIPQYIKKHMVGIKPTNFTAVILYCTDSVLSDNYLLQLGFTQ